QFVATTFKGMLETKKVSYLVGDRFARSPGAIFLYNNTTALQILHTAKAGKTTGAGNIRYKKHIQATGFVVFYLHIIPFVTLAQVVKLVIGDRIESANFKGKADGFEIFIEVVDLGQDICFEDIAVAGLVENDVRQDGHLFIEAG